jgi:hypothetical protein
LKGFAEFFKDKVNVLGVHQRQRPTKKNVKAASRDWQFKELKPVTEF